MKKDLNGLKKPDVELRHYARITLEDKNCDDQIENQQVSQRTIDAIEFPERAKKFRFFDMEVEIETIEGIKTAKKYSHPKNLGPEIWIGEIVPLEEIGDYMGKDNSTYKFLANNPDIRPIYCGFSSGGDYANFTTYIENENAQVIDPSTVKYRNESKKEQPVKKEPTAKKLNTFETLNTLERNLILIGEAKSSDEAKEKAKDFLRS